MDYQRCSKSKYNYIASLWTHNDNASQSHGRSLMAHTVYYNGPITINKSTNYGYHLPLVLHSCTSVEAYMIPMDGRKYLAERIVTEDMRAKQYN